MSQQLVVVLEYNNTGDLWGRIQDLGNFMPCTVGKNIEEIAANLRMLMEDYMAHEGKDDPAWCAVDWQNAEFVFEWDAHGEES